MGKIRESRKAKVTILTVILIVLMALALMWFCLAAMNYSRDIVATQAQHGAYVMPPVDSTVLMVMLIVFGSILTIIGAIVGVNVSMQGLIDKAAVKASAAGAVSSGTTSVGG